MMDLTSNFILAPLQTTFLKTLTPYTILEITDLQSEMDKMMNPFQNMLAQQ